MVSCSDETIDSIAVGLTSGLTAHSAMNVYTVIWSMFRHMVSCSDETIDNTEADLPNASTGHSVMNVVHVQTDGTASKETGSCDIAHMGHDIVSIPAVISKFSGLPS